MNDEDIDSPKTDFMVSERNKYRGQDEDFNTNNTN